MDKRLVGNFLFAFFSTLSGAQVLTGSITPNAFYLALWNACVAGGLAAAAIIKNDGEIENSGKLAAVAMLTLPFGLPR